MKIRLLFTLAALAIGLATPTLAQLQNTVDPEVRQEIEAVTKIERLEARAQSRSEENGDLADERTRALRANRMRSEMLLAKARGELIVKDLVEKQAAYLLIAMRQKILGIPQTYCRRLAGISDPKAMQAALKEMSLSILNEIKHLPERVTDPHWLETLEHNGKGKPLSETEG